MADWLKNAIPLDEQQAPQQRGGVFIADQGAIDDARRDQTRTDIAVEGNERDAARFERDAGREARQGTSELRKEYYALPGVRDYRTAIQSLAAALKRGDDGSGDTALIYDYVKALDPTSVVREAEVGMAQGSDAKFNALVAQAKKEFGMDSGGNLSPEARKRLKREIITSVIPRVKQYNQLRGQYEELARRSNYDPYAVVGDHDATPYLDTFREYDQRNGLGEFARGQGRGVIPGAAPDNITFDMDTGTGAFGSEIKGPRMTPPQEAAYRSFIQANMGNPNFGPDQVNAFYQSIGLQGADLTGSDAFFDAVRKGEPVGDINYSLTDEAAKRAALEASLAEAPEGTDLSTVGLQKGLLLNMTDELRGGIGGIRSLLSGDGFMSGYQSERDIERALQERSREQNGLLPELTGGLLTPAGLVSRANMARDAAGMGAIAGFGEGEGAVDSLGKAATGGAIGYGAGKAFDAAAPIVANSAIGQRVSTALAPNAERQAFADAAERQSLDYLPADVPGRRGTQFATSVSKATLGGIPIADAAAAIRVKAQAARERIAGSIGEATDNAGAGQAAQRGMEAWEKQTSGRGGELYEAIPIKPDMPVDLSTTRQTLAELNNNISSNAELASLVRDPKMAAYQKALEAGDLSWKDIKSFRSYIGEKAGRPTLQQDTSKDSLDALYGALSQDIQRAATAHSPEAAKAFTRANNYWRGRQARLNDVMTKLVGKDGNMSPEATFAQVERWAGSKGGDFGKLAQAIRSLPADEANTIRATIIDRLGNKAAGDDDSFSTDVFLTQWSKLSDRGKAILFQGDHRKALDDVVKVFEGSKASRGFDNNSKTGVINTALSSGAVGLVDPVSGLVFAALQYGGGKLLASPRFARWLAASAKKPNPSAQLAHVNQLTAIARSEPIIANDIFTLQERLAAEFSRSPGSLAAQDTGDGRGEPPAQGERGNAP